MYRVSFIGAGNLAFRLSLALHEAGHKVEYIFNRSPENGVKLERALKKNGSEVRFTEDPCLLLQSDIIFIAVSDSAIKEVITLYSEILQFGKAFDNIPIFLHTSGATDIALLKDLKIDNYGVFYPLMTLSKNKGIDFNIVPFILEASTEKVKSVVKEMAVSLRSEYIFVPSEKRLQLHLAAVFSTNFVNHMLAIAFDISGDTHNYLLPTTMETIRKSFLLSPDKVQTGPALREDIVTMEKHIALLDELGMEKERELYEILSKSIIRRKNELQDETE